MDLAKNIVFLALAVSTIGCSSSSPNEAPPTSLASTQTVAGDSIPFPIYMSFGEFEPHLKHTNDTTYVVNFWATWCKPCMEELPFFEKLIPAVAGKPVKILLVSMDFPKDYQKKLMPFIESRQLSQHVVALGDLDYDAWIEKVSVQWDGAIPFTLIYNKKGRKEKMGEFANYEELYQLLEGL